MLIGNTLYEIKARSGGFESRDVRQVLCYLALAQAARRPIINNVVLVNPRLGVALRSTVDDLIMGTSGGHASTVLQDLIAYVSEPLWLVSEES